MTGQIQQNPTAVEKDADIYAALAVLWEEFQSDLERIKESLATASKQSEPYGR